MSAPETAASERVSPASLGSGAGLGAEWARLSHLIAMAEALRGAQALPEDFAAEFEAVSEAVAEGRSAGAWRGLARCCERSLLATLTNLDLDVLATALLGDAMPVLGPRLMTLQPHLRTAYPGLGLLQELLAMDQPEAADLLFSRLAPGAPLIAGHLVQIERQAGEPDGGFQVVRPGPGVAQAVLGRAVDLGPPPGAHLTRRTAAWEDLVLPEPTLARLRELLAWTRQRRRVERDWRARGLGGPLALFSGGSGTGKTFAAAAIAGELGWPLYALDLGRVMSKWVGETEQNVNRLLDALHGRPAVLAIDECDALLGKRGEISDARDRYANLEVSHLLSRLERHDGPVILTTNLRSNIDHAFLRRFQMVIDFPPPDPSARARLWDTLLPAGAPRAPELDVAMLGAAATLSGGAIHNAAFHAAVLAAEADTPIGPREVALAVWREMGKDNRPVRRSELGALAAHLPDRILEAGAA